MTAPADPIGVPVAEKPFQPFDELPWLTNNSSCPVEPLAPTTRSLKPLPVTLPVASALAYGVLSGVNAGVLAKPCQADGVTAAPLANVVVAAVVSVKLVAVSDV